MARDRLGRGADLPAQNAERHAEVVQQLIDGGHAYRSTAGPDEVKAFKEQHGNRGFRGEEEGAGAWRLRVPDEGVTEVNDVIRGGTEFENALLDDLVIARADGTPVYHLAVVVDDADAGITHVVRGADHYSNTPKHVLIQQAIGAPTPTYAHLPLLHGPDGKKLSKRHGAASVQDLREAGYLPEAVLNYLALLGWGYDESTEFHSIAELQERFSLERVSKSPAVFDETSCATSTAAICGRSTSTTSRRAWRPLPGGPGSATRSPSRRTRSARWPSSGRSPASSSTVRPTTPRPARRPSRRPAAARRSRRRGRRSSRFRSPGPRRTCSPRSTAWPIGWASSASRSFSHFASLWLELPSHRVSSRQSRCSGATRLWLGWIMRSMGGRGREPAGRRRGRLNDPSRHADTG